MQFYPQGTLRKLPLARVWHKSWKTSAPTHLGRPHLLWVSGFHEFDSLGQTLPCLVSVAVIKPPDSQRLRGEWVCLSSQFQVGVQHRSEVSGAAAHVHSQEQRIDWPSHALFSVPFYTLTSSQPQIREWSHLHTFRWVLTILIKAIRTTCYR